MRNHNYRRQSSRFPRILTVRRVEVVEVMHRGGFTSPTAALRRLFPAMVRYWSRGADFVILTTH